MLRVWQTRKEVFNWLRDKEMNAYMLQEAHFTKENENIIEAEWGFKCIFSICSSQSCGVALLFNNNFQFVIKNTVFDEHDRYIICELELNIERIIVINFYELNTDNTLLLKSFIDDIGNFNDKPLICGGDWNLVLDETDINKTLQQLINDKGDTITDFKEVLAEERSFHKTLYSKNHTVYDNINEINNFFFPDDPEITKLSEEDMLNCEGIISKDECVSAIRTFKMVNRQEQMDFQQNFIKYFGMMSLI
jgi:exonuclease III